MHARKSLNTNQDDVASYVILFAQIELSTNSLCGNVCSGHQNNLLLFLHPLQRF